MFFAALAADYDGTIATDGLVPDAVFDALKRFKETGRRLILVTGRELPDLQAAFPGHEIFDRIVAENGALLYEQAAKRETVLGPPPPASFVEALRQANVTPLSVGRVIVATWEPNENMVLDLIKSQGLEHQIIFNKGAVMVLPPGVNKASGLAAALTEMKLSPVNVVGVGDAENDHAFLTLCGCSAAVANALAKVKDRADLNLSAPRGDGVMELMARISAEDGALLPPRRHGILLGTSGEQEILLQPHGGNVLIVGHSAAGKSTLATALTEKMAQKNQQFVILDPEGDFESLEQAVQAGEVDLPPSLAEVTDLLENPASNLVVNTLAVPLDSRPAFFADFLAGIASLRRKNGRPHWLIVDEAHHVLPQSLDNVGESLPQVLEGTIFITVHPDALSRSILDKVRFLVAAGEEAEKELALFYKAANLPDPGPAAGDAPFLWDREAKGPPRALAPITPIQIHRRHVRKYAEGDLGEERSFYFRGPEQALNLRAQNFTSFLDIGEGVDEATWAHHRAQGDYSAWVRNAIKDDKLAAAIAAIEGDHALDTAEARHKLRQEIEKRYTAPARG
jgi:hydroxymethylpyrimidine pyrophosphatase-like HAD family hydrolase